MVGTPCCDGKPDCQYCQTDTQPDEVRVTFSGWRNHVCNNCAGWNTSFDLSKFAGTAICLWHDTFDIDCGSTAPWQPKMNALSLSLWLGPTRAGRAALTLWATCGSAEYPDITWTYTFANVDIGALPFDCSTFNDTLLLTMGPFRTSAPCDATTGPATCTVVSL